MTVEDVVERLAASFRAGEAAVFCGAGLSFRSGLPLVSQLVPRALETTGATRKEIRVMMRSGLPFEAFVEMLGRYTPVDDLLRLFDLGEPNTNHLLLAKLIRRGNLKTVVTTNFDRLIEKACAQEGLQIGRDVAMSRNDAEFERIDWKSDTPRLIKIHGSAEDREGMAVTLSRVAARALSEPSRAAVQRMFVDGPHRVVLVFGYSCSDVFDISPFIETAEGPRKEVVCVEHSPAAAAVEDVRTRQANNPFRRYEGSWRLSCDADQLVRRLWETLIDEEPYGFRSGTTEWTGYVDDLNGHKDDRWTRRRFTDAMTLAGLFERIGELLLAKKHLRRARWLSFFMTRFVWERNPEREILVALARVSAAMGETKGRRYAERVERMDRKAFSELDFVPSLKKRFVREGEDERVADLRGAISQGATAIHPYWPGILDAYLQLGDRYRVLGQDDTARSTYQGGLSLCRDQSLPAHEIRFLSSLALLDRDEGKHAEAIEAWEKALPPARATGDKHAEASLLVQLGDIHNGLGHHEEALKLFRESKVMFRQIGDAQNETYAEIGEGAALSCLGEQPQARASLEHALREARRIGEKDREGRALLQCGIVYARMGDGANAVVGCFQKARKLFRKTGDRNQEALASLFLGMAWSNMGYAAKAIAEYEEARSVAAAFLRSPAFLEDVEKRLADLRQSRQ